MAGFKIPRIVIAGTHSGAGKTTVVTGLLAALRGEGYKVQSYKVGPDYIDPGFHAAASGKPAHNLDTWLIPEDQLVRIFADSAQSSDIAIIEGVMGLFDGGRHGVSSTAAIAKLLQAPVVLVVDAKSAGESIAATVLGFNMYDPDLKLAGVIVNRLGSDSHRQTVVGALEKLQIPVLGCLYRDQALIMPERHLGLTPVTERETEKSVDAMRQQVQRSVNIEHIQRIAAQAPAIICAEAPSLPQRQSPPAVRIGIARDAAFSFYYPESLAVLTASGAELFFFSPLEDSKLPPVDGIILGGGFPEMFAKELAVNRGMLCDIREKAGQGMPVYAECGGLMYLTRQLIDFEQQPYEMAGLIPARCQMHSKLETVGYIEATAWNDNLLCQAQAVLRGHEFHFSRMIPEIVGDDFPWAFQFKKMRTGAAYPAGYAKGNILASYLHIHFAGSPGAADSFIRKCMIYAASRG
ncbi:cobyrinate a,c-diamide synthase [Acetonema longum]|uniref:Cobyrinate a,c-diamide synthase n=1 Tax=Acetonema longum DSM 6540 TaxID=1009370 RepID=F7NPX5_9FIRM|nr:cobyrinate a,c-diamide synthase [Acetonema longum]EGO61966.1 cobyrinic acid a,c-diamide synthase [Acetonema longum DSM 6540]